MAIPPIEANHDAGKVASGEVGDLAVERTALINHFERGQNPVLLGILKFGHKRASGDFQRATDSFGDCS